MKGKAAESGEQVRRGTADGGWVFRYIKDSFGKRTLPVENIANIFIHFFLDILPICGIIYL
jgi:hypothetical protein